MSTTAVEGGGRWSNGVGERTRSTRLHLIRGDRPREQEEGRRFLIIASASRSISQATSLSEALASITSALVPALADRCTLHATPRRGDPGGIPGARSLRTSSLPEGHPLRECARRRQSMIFSTTSTALLRKLDPCPADAAPALGGCVHALLTPIVLDRRVIVLTLLRGFARGSFDADDLLVAELAMSRLPTVLRREGMRFHG
ncbi:MAG TPA: hypothetical protein VFU06_01420 [Longimicrobiales bacterium]|nr:hypothetical protein [Longimicrobiales bacterium]